MRNYPCNSPEAAARLVAWTMLADGHACDKELATHTSLGVPERLGISEEAWHTVVRELCEDLLATGESSWELAVQLESATVGAMTSELDDPVLYCRVLGLCATVAEANGRVSDAERRALASLAGRHAMPARPLLRVAT